MKVAVFVLIALTASVCLASPRRALVGVVADVINSNKDKISGTGGGSGGSGHLDGTTENHHNIPRQYYNQWGTTPSGGDDNGDNGSGN
ncbi:hypothetical protein ABFS83_10G045200 [Erythranthe nasuta]